MSIAGRLGDLLAPEGRHVYSTAAGPSTKPQRGDMCDVIRDKSSAYQRGNGRRSYKQRLQNMGSETAHIKC